MQTRWAYGGLVAIGILLSPSVASSEPGTVVTPVVTPVITPVATQAVSPTIDRLAQAPTVDREQRIIDGVYLNNQGWSFLNATTYDASMALAKFQEALAIFRQVGAAGGEATSLQGIGAVYLRQQDYPKALDWLQQALALWRRLGDDEQVGYTLGYLGDAYTGLNQYDQALQQYQAALPLYDRSGDRIESGARASLLQSLGGTYFRLGQYPQALKYYQQVLAIYDRGFLRAQVLNNIGVVYVNQGNYAQALETYQTALDLIRTVGDCYRTDPGPRLCFYGDESAILNNLAAVYFYLGDYKRALDYSEQASTIYRRLSRNEVEETSPTNIKLLYDALGNNSQAIAALGQELTNRASAGENLDQDPVFFGRLHISLPANEALNLNNLGQIYAYVGQYDQATQLFRRALAIYRDLNSPVGESIVLNNIGNVSISQGQYAVAIATYQQALVRYQQVNDQAGAANSLNNLGSAYRRLNQFSQALASYQRSLALYRQVKDQAGEATVLSNLGRFQLDQRQYAEAATLLQTAVQKFEGLRSRLKDTEKIALLDTQQATYNALQQTLVAQGQPQQALVMAERGRARAFVDLLASRLQGKTLAPNASASAASGIQPMTIADIQQTAKTQNATLVEYAIINPDTLYIWVVKPTGEIAFAQVKPSQVLPAGGSLDDVIDASRNDDLGISGRGITFVEDVTIVSQAIAQTQPRADTTSNLQRLYTLLIAPIAQHLPTDPRDRVVIIPQGKLFLIPFAALPNAQGQVLMEAHTLLSAPAIQVLQFTHQQHQRLAAATPCPLLGNETAACAASPNSLVIVGNPTMPTINTPPQQLASLPGAEAEAKAIAQLLGTQALVGDQATKATVVQRMQQARLIHLATHGLLDDYKGLGIPGAIALAPDPAAATSQPAIPPNGLLTASEILDLNLRAELVVLSACDTGRGRVTGDGVIGLSRSLISAGVPSVIVSLWKVSDDSTQFLMEQFYHELQQPGTDKAQALRQAMLSTRQQYPDPKDWAAFTLIGDAN